MTIKFDIKIDLHKKLMGFECRKCSTVTTKKELTEEAITIICPKCETTEIYNRKPLDKDKKHPLSFLFSESIA